MQNGTRGRERARSARQQHAVTRTARVVSAVCIASSAAALLAIPATVAGCASSRSTGVAGRRVFSALLPRSFVRRVADPRGGSMWAGVIPNTDVPAARRPSAIYLPPAVSRRRRYPLVILLHGFRGSPYGYVYGLRFAQIADREIGAHRVPPFIAIMPAAGESVRYNGEWAGVWERFVVHDVLSWANRHLPVRRGRAARTIGGDSAVPNTLGCRSVMSTAP